MSIEEVRNYLNVIRRDFANRPLTEDSVKKDPVEQYSVWFEEAVGAQLLDPYAMCLSTVDKQGFPSSRIVYVRDLIDGNFVFYTNYNSSKSKEIEANPKVSVNFFWGELERQIRMRGEVKKTSPEVSDKYFAGRPRESQIGAWASKQSEVLSSREALEKEVERLTEKFKNVEQIPRPDFWGGYEIIPNYFEFWQGRPSRLHDRIAYEKTPKGDWEIKRLNP